MPLSADDSAFLKSIYQNLQDRALERDDPRYVPVYEHPGCDDPVLELEGRIDYAFDESVSLFSGFRGSGKTTELFRLRRRLQDAGATVLYADALEYLNPASPVEIGDLLVTLAGAFSDALNGEGIDIGAESYWTRLKNALLKTEVGIKELGLKTGTENAGADLKLEFRSSPRFRNCLSQHLNERIGELRDEVWAFFEQGVKAVRERRGENVRVVFLFDSLEQIRGSISNERDVARSVELLFSMHLRNLEIPYVHVVYIVPPGLKVVLPGVNMTLLPCIALWKNDATRTRSEVGEAFMRTFVTRRFWERAHTTEGLTRFFGEDPFRRAGKLIDLCGGHFRDLLLLLRETILRADSLPVSDETIARATARVASNFLPVSAEDAVWLAEIADARATLLRSKDQSEVYRLVRFLDTHVVLYFKNGTEWYDVHPLIRGEAARMARLAIGERA